MIFGENIAGVFLGDNKVAVLGKAIEFLPHTVFSDERGGVNSVKNRLRVLDRVFVLVGVRGNESAANAYVALGPLELVEFGEVLDEILIGLEALGDLAKIDYSGSSEFIPNFADNGMG